jgi:hypothetical protein
MASTGIFGPGIRPPPVSTFFRQATVSQPPSSFGNWNSPTAYFTGDLSKVQLAAMNFITGATTLGQPTTGYQFTEEAYPFLGGLYNSSGFNNSNSTNDGRTSANFSRIHIYQAGQGDCVAFNATAFLASTNANATNFLASPAVSILNGGVLAGVGGGYLNPVEIDLDDGGFDVSGIAFVTNLKRTNSTGALGTWWCGFRAQSTGTQALDVVFSGSGPAKIGLDLSFLTLDSNNSAITLKADQRIYWNVTATDPNSQSRFPSSVSTTATWFSSSNIGFQMTVNNTNIYLLTVATAFFYPATTVIGQGQNNRFSLTNGGNGTVPTIATTGTSDADVDIGFNPKGNGLVKLVNSANMAANGSVATALTSVGPSGSNTTVQEWLKIKNSAGTTRYIPLF